MNKCKIVEDANNGKKRGTHPLDTGKNPVNN